jgi:hypothetical protein
LAILFSINWVSIGFASGRSVALTPEPDFTIIAMPDTQHYTDNAANYANFSAQTQWIVNNKDSKNIKAVTHLGDIVEHGNNFGDDTEWLVADAAMALIEDPTTTSLADGIPYGVAPGNHDLGDTGDGSNGESASFNKFFGVSRFQGRDYYGGSYNPALNDNNYELFSASGYDFIIIHIEWRTPQDPAVLNWADNLLKTNPTRWGIAVTHNMVKTGNPGDFSSQGQAIYNALKDNPNLFLMLGGHTPGEGRREDIYNGHKVYSLLSNYQGRPNGGDGWLRIMEFSPANNEIRIKTYSPVLDQYETDADSQFTLPFSFDGNLSPYVNAGPDQTIAFGVIANLDGIVFDDGNPDPPGEVTTTWSVVARPQPGAQVDFADPSSAITTATFHVPGDYILRLTADDSEWTNFDDIAITVQLITNQPPSVSAGDNQIITLPEDATLNGNVTDDGLPDPPGSYTTLWSKSSGEGPVSFANASAESTTASFTIEGVYVLRLTADDSDLTNYDEVTITVSSGPNQAPVVDAGSAQTITLPDNAILDGTVSDDGQGIPPGRLNVLWIESISPGLVTFADQQAEDTTATFSKSGVYELKLTAFDGEHYVEDAVIINVNPAPVTFIWIPVIISIPVYP